MFLRHARLRFRHTREMEESEGFEPIVPFPTNSFQDCRNKPLCQLSIRARLFIRMEPPPRPAPCGPVERRRTVPFIRQFADGFLTHPVSTEFSLSNIFARQVPPTCLLLICLVWVVYQYLWSP